MRIADEDCIVFWNKGNDISADVGDKNEKFYVATITNCNKICCCKKDTCNNPNLNTLSK